MGESRMNNDSNLFFSQHLADVPVVLILRDMSPSRSREMARLAWDLGVSLVEVPVASPSSIESLAAVVDESRGGREIAGAGSIKSSDDIRRCIDVGASFGVSPGMSLDVADAARAAGFPWLPGVATSSDIMHALSRGHEWVKAFPAQSLGAGWFAAQAGPFPEVSFVATGGVSVDNASDVLAHGASALGVGGGAASPEALRQIVTIATSARNAQSGA